MKTIFLAAGRSSRMKPISDKNFLDFCGMPLIYHLLHNAHKGGLKNFIIVGNEDNIENIKTLCKEHSFLKEATITMQSNLDEGMAGGIIEGLNFVTEEESVTILGGNDYVNPEIYQRILDESAEWNGGILAKKMEKYFPGGYLEIDLDQRIQSIIEKPGEGNEPSEVVNIVVHHFNQALDIKLALKEAASSEDDTYEVALDALFKSGRYKAIEYDDYWQAVKYPWHILELMDLILQQDPQAILGDRIHEFQEALPSVWIHNTCQGKVVTNGSNIIVDEGVKPYHNACISGPAYIGKNTTLGNNSLVRGSMIGHHSAVGFNTEVVRSYLSHNVTSHIAYIGDSVIDQEVNFGAYSCTANLRFDKRTVRVEVKGEKIDSGMNKLGAIVGAGAQIGIHASIMPGAKIDPGEFVTPSAFEK